MPESHHHVKIFSSTVEKSFVNILLVSWSLCVGSWSVEACAQFILMMNKLDQLLADISYLICFDHISIEKVRLLATIEKAIID